MIIYCVNALHATDKNKFKVEWNGNDDSLGGIGILVQRQNVSRMLNHNRNKAVSKH